MEPPLAVRRPIRIRYADALTSVALRTYSREQCSGVDLVVDGVDECLFESVEDEQRNETDERSTRHQQPPLGANNLHLSTTYRPID